MGLDVYVGSLTRYYAGEWETIVQRIGRKEGFEVSVVRVGETTDAITDPAEIQQAISLWIEGLAEALADHLPSGTAFTWQDDIAQPYFTDKPAWDCYGSLLLWAAYAEHPELERPTDFVEDWASDPAYQASSSAATGSIYGQLLDGVELWLPVDFSFTFGASDAAGNETAFGSCQELLRELEHLNQATWRADASQLAEWQRAGARYQSPLELGARFAFAVLWDLCRCAVLHRLPMKLDY